MVHAPLNVLEALMVALSGIVIVFIMLALLWGVIICVSRAVGKLESMPAFAPAPTPKPAFPLPTMPTTAPRVELVGIEETQAACVMAIVSHETGIPLSELVFKSIKAK